MPPSVLALASRRLKILPATPVEHQEELMKKQHYFYIDS